MKKIASSFLSCFMILLLFLGVFPLPALANEAEAVIAEVEAGAALLMDVNFDTPLYEKNAYARMYPASITKVMTALLVLEAIDRGEMRLSTVITTSQEALFDITDDSSTQNIQPGEQMTVEDLLYCLMVASANEASNILAEAVSGSVSAFVADMNIRAAELGMTGTNFTNPHGLHRDQHYTTAYDIYLMTREAMTYATFQKIVSTEHYNVPATNLSEERNFVNTNALITARRYASYTYDYATGVKTGFTPEAGNCLVSSAQREDRYLICVVLGAEVVTEGNRTTRYQFTESKRLLQDGFSKFQARTLLGSTSVLKEVPVEYGKDVAHVTGRPDSTIDVMLPISYDEALLDITVNLYDEAVSAPVEKGQVLGTVIVSYDGTVYGTSNLIADYAVERSHLKWAFGHLGTLVTSPILWGGVLLVFLIILFRYLKALRRKPRRPKQNQSQAKQKPYRGKPRR